MPEVALVESLRQAPQLTDEQVELVRAFCSNGHRLQTAIGRPGMGKTTSMRTARQAWETAGYRVRGAAVKGEAARHLEAATGIPSETMAWYLAQEDPLSAPVDARTVLVVDEASTVSDRDLHRLLWLADALRAGNVNEALGHLARAGHLHVVEDELDAYVQVLSAWWSAHLDGLDHPMVDRRNSVRRSSTASPTRSAPPTASWASITWPAAIAGSQSATG